MIFGKADKLPSEDALYGPDLTGLINPEDAGGRLVVVPLLGGSGPESAAPLPYSLGLGSEATNAITVPIHADVPEGTTLCRWSAGPHVRLLGRRHQPPRRQVRRKRIGPSSKK